jgi:L-methionine (R)-S-oxide reductase
MHPITRKDSNALEKPALYERIHADLAALLEGERDFIANAANCAALLYQSLPDINWAGFYLLKGSDLVLGPFQGKPACVRIGPGRGVCGAAAAAKKTVVVANVHEFPGHIACDTDSNSEIVVPLIKGDHLLGVLDLDSPTLGRFDAVDRTGLQAIAATLVEASDA